MLELVKKMLLQMFAIFCGLGIHNVMNYEQKCKALAHYSVALEVSVCHCRITLVTSTPLPSPQQMSYHTTASSEESDYLSVSCVHCLYTQPSLTCVSTVTSSMC